LRRSQVRFYEKFLKALTSSRPYRCVCCRARVWGHFQSSQPVKSRDTGKPEPGWVQTSSTKLPDLSALDRVLGKA
jgi:hypothetical protein